MSVALGNLREWLTSLPKLVARHRLDEVARRLRQTSLPVSQIARACSFGNLQHLANAFRRCFGQSMTGYRKTARQ